MKQPQEDYKQKTCPVCGKVFFCYTETWCYHRTPFGKSRKIPLFMEMPKQI